MTDTANQETEWRSGLMVPVETEEQSALARSRGVIAALIIAVLTPMRALGVLPKPPQGQGGPGSGQRGDQSGGQPQAEAAATANESETGDTSSSETSTSEANNSATVTSDVSADATAAVEPAPVEAAASVAPSQAPQLPEIDFLEIGTFISVSGLIAIIACIAGFILMRRPAFIFSWGLMISAIVFAFIGLTLIVEPFGDPKAAVTAVTVFFAIVGVVLNALAVITAFNSLLGSIAERRFQSEESVFSRA